jgi:tetratricopeptide (TPR) repeat protein
MELPVKLLLISLGLYFFVGFNANAIEPLNDEEISQHEIFYKAEKARKSEDFRAAIKLYKYAYSEKLNRNTTLKGLVFTYVEADDTFAAEQFLLVDIEKNLFDIEPRIHLVEVYLASKDFKKAERQIQVSKNIAPGDWRLKYLLGQAHTHQRKYAEAVEAYSDCISVKGCKNDVYMFRGLAHFHLKQYEKAYPDLKQAFAFNSNSFDLILPYAAVLHGTNRFEESSAVIQQCVKVDSTKAECWKFSGDYYAKQNNMALAVQHYEKAVKLAPFNFEFRKHLAAALIASNRFAEADMHYEKALSLNPKDAGALRAWVTNLKTRDLNAKVSQLLQKHYNSKLPDLWAANELAQAYNLVGKKDAALSVIEAAHDKIKSVDADIYYSYYLTEAGEYKDAQKIMSGSKIDSERKKYYSELIKSFEAQSKEARNVSSQDSAAPIKKMNSITDWNLPKL